ncbi:MAG: hypothetical protein ACO331_10610 [Prochlorothrix sp.]
MTSNSSLQWQTIAHVSPWTVGFFMLVSQGSTSIDRKQDSLSTSVALSPTPDPP